MNLFNEFKHVLKFCSVSLHQITCLTNLEKLKNRKNQEFKIFLTNQSQAKLFAIYMKPNLELLFDPNLNNFRKLSNYVTKLLTEVKLQEKSRCFCMVWEGPGC